MRRAAIIALLMSFGAVAASAGTLTGTVRNGTTGKPAGNVDVAFINVMAQMDILGGTKTDAQGRFTFENAVVGTNPILVRVPYRGVNFHANVPPGRNTAEIEIFEATSDRGVLEVESRLVVVQPNGATLLVGEEYTVGNHSKPPMAFWDNAGTFGFRLPEGATLNQVSAWGPAATPVIQGTMDKGPNSFAIAYALKPGSNGIRISYEMAYPGNQALLPAPSPYAIGRVTLIAPPTVTVAGEGFEPEGQEQGWNLYQRRGVRAGAVLAASVSGTAPRPGAEGTSGGNESAAGSSIRVEQVPGRVGELQWVLVGGFAALFFLGAIFLWRKQVPAGGVAGVSGHVVSGSEREAPRGPRKRRAEQRREEAVTAVKEEFKREASAPAEAPVSLEAIAAARAEVERQIQKSLEDLKEAIFRLELRKQAGTIGEEEYAQEKARNESLLRELLKG